MFATVVSIILGLLDCLFVDDKNPAFLGHSWELLGSTWSYLTLRRRKAPTHGKHGDKDWPAYICRSWSQECAVTQVAVVTEYTYCVQTTS